MGFGRAVSCASAGEDVSSCVMTTTATASGRKAKLTAKQRAEIQSRANALKAFGDPARLEIIALLRATDAESTIAVQAGLEGRLSQPTVSHHLKVLTQAGIVRREKIGVFSRYRLLPERLSEIAAWLAPSI